MMWIGIGFTMSTLNVQLKPTCVIIISNFSIYRAICTDQFLHKIRRADSRNCHFCKKYPESIFRLLCFLINNVSGESFNFSNLFKITIIETKHD